MPQFLRQLSLFLVALGLLYLGMRYGMREVAVEAERKDAVISEDPAWASWKERRFEALGFSLRHPQEFPIAEGADRSHPVDSLLPGGATAVYTVMLPKTRYKNTNFIHAYVTVAIGREEAPPSGGSSGCYLMARANSTAETMSKRETFGGTTFAVAGTSGAAAGGVGERIVYHTWRRGRCLEITANLFRTASTRGTQVDRVEVWKSLTDVVHTFRSLDESP
jgi:hypothetical protein